MNSIDEILKAIQNQNHTNANILGMTSILGMADAIRQRNELNYNLSGLKGITDLAKMFSKQNKLNIGTTAIFDKSIISHLASNKFSKNNFAMFGLTSSLIEIAKNNHSLSEKISGLASSQLFLSNNLIELAKGMTQSHLNKFNSLNIALQGISWTYLKDIEKSKKWDDIDIAEQANQSIIVSTNTFVTQSNQITLQDLDNLKHSIIGELSILLTKTRTEKARQFIIRIITVLSILISFYSLSLQLTDKTNQDVIDENKKEIVKFKEELSDEFVYELNKLQKTRIAITDVKLRKYAKKNCEIIGLVKVGQEVTVIEIRKKYLLIAYKDKETKEAKSGFVIKKYFERQ